MKKLSLVLALFVFVATATFPKRSEAVAGFAASSTALIIAGASTAFYPLLASAVVVADKGEDSVVVDIILFPFRILPCSGWGCLGGAILSAGAIIGGGVLLLNEESRSFEFQKISAKTAKKYKITSQELAVFNNEVNLAQMNRVYQSMARAMVRKHNKNYKEYVDHDQESAAIEYGKIIKRDINNGWLLAKKKGLIPNKSFAVLLKLSQKKQ